METKKENKSVTVENMKNVITTQNGKVIQENVNVKSNVLDNVLKSFSSDFKSSKGFAKENIYKKEIFSDCITDREKKTQRRKIRNILENVIANVLRAKTPSQLQNAIKDFRNFYENVYATNDYSLQSLVSENTSDEKKTNIKHALEIIKKSF